MAARDHRDLVIETLVDSEAALRAELADARVLTRQLAELLADLAFESYELHLAYVRILTLIDTARRDAVRERDARLADGTAA